MGGVPEQNRANKLTPPLTGGVADLDSFPDVVDEGLISASVGDEVAEIAAALMTVLNMASDSPPHHYQVPSGGGIDCRFGDVGKTTRPHYLPIFPGAFCDWFPWQNLSRAHALFDRPI